MYRICAQLNHYFHYQQFCELLKTRELTQTRVNRALLHIMLGIKKKNVAAYTSDHFHYYADVYKRQGQDIEKEFGIPIVNKRISITPIALVGAAACKCPEDFVEVAKTLDRAAKEVGVNFIGGYSALVSKAMTKSDENLIRSIPQALAVTERICSSVNVGSTKTGINMDAVRLCGEIVKATAEATKENDSLGCAKLVIFCNAPDDNPFMACLLYTSRCV